MPDQSKRYWFLAKRYGWGWGLPSTWQGWLISVVWLTVAIVVSPWIATRSMLLFGLFQVAMITLIIAICYAKGEPPRWRWGDK